MAVSASYTPALPISWGQFVQDMKEKWRYKYGSPDVRDALMRAQAQYYTALAERGIPSEAFYREALGQRALQELEFSKVDQELMQQFIRELAPLFGGLTGGGLQESAIPIRLTSQSNIATEPISVPTGGALPTGVSPAKRDNYAEISQYYNRSAIPVFGWLADRISNFLSRYF